MFVWVLCDCVCVCAQCLDSDIAVHTSRTPLLYDLLSHWLSVSKATRRRWLIGAERQEGVFSVRSAFW